MAGKEADHAPCPRCGGQPEVTKWRSFWRARCPKDHILRVETTPMKTKAKALEAWDIDVGQMSATAGKSSAQGMQSGG